MVEYFSPEPDRESTPSCEHCLSRVLGMVTALRGRLLTWCLRMPPGCNMDDYYTVFRSGMWRLWYKLTPEGRKRYFDEFFTVLHDTK